MKSLVSKFIIGMSLVATTSSAFASSFHCVEIYEKKQAKLEKKYKKYTSLTYSLFNLESGMVPHMVYTLSVGAIAGPASAFVFFGFYGHHAMTKDAERTSAVYSKIKSNNNIQNILKEAEYGKEEQEKAYIMARVAGYNWSLNYDHNKENQEREEIGLPTLSLDEYIEKHNKQSLQEYERSLSEVNNYKSTIDKLVEGYEGEVTYEQVVTYLNDESKTDTFCPNDKILTKAEFTKKIGQGVTGSDID